MYKAFVSILLVFVFLLNSCIVQSPQYTYIENVMKIKVGMTKEQVEDSLKLAPYNLKAVTDTSTVFVYVYRVHERATLAHLTRPHNGKRVLGKYYQLNVAYSKDSSKVVGLESCTTCPDNLVTVSKVNINMGKILTFVTVTLPVILVYIGLKE